MQKDWIVKNMSRKEFDIFKKSHKFELFNLSEFKIVNKYVKYKDIKFLKFELHRDRYTSSKENSMVESNCIYIAGTLGIFKYEDEWYIVINGYTSFGDMNLDDYDSVSYCICDGLDGLTHLVKNVFKS